MIIQAIIAVAFLATTLLSALTRIHPGAFGCLVPVVATALLTLTISFWPSGSSSEGVALPLIFLFAAAGSVPGAFVGGWIRSSKGEEL